MKKTKKIKFYNKKLNKYFKEEYIKILKIFFVLIILNIFIYYLSNLDFRKFISIDFVYIGEGNAALLKTKTKNILIDTGEGGGKKYEHGLKTFLPYILFNKIKNIDEIYITHLDTDHFGGSLYIIKYLNVKKIYLPYGSKNYTEFKKLEEICKKRNTKIFFIGKGYNKKIEEKVYLNVLWPEESNKEIKREEKEIKKEKTKENKNNNSLVLKLNIYGKKILFPGDIEKESEEKLVKKYSKSELKSDILLSPHHGSKTSSTDVFLEKVDPKAVIISCGKNNMFRHPNKEVLERYIKRKIKIYRTDENGLVSIKILKNKYNMLSFRQN